jgi:hypothetical protein
MKEPVPWEAPFNTVFPVNKTKWMSSSEDIVPKVALNLTNPHLYQDVRILQSPNFHKALNHVLTEQWMAVTGAILKNRLNLGVFPKGTIVIGSCPPHIYYGWIRKHLNKPQWKTRMYKQTVCGEIKRVPRQYFTWITQLPSLEPSKWWENEHYREEGNRIVKSWYRSIQFIYRPSDHRVWCKYEQVSGIEVSQGKWARIA